MIIEKRYPHNDYAKSKRKNLRCETTKKIRKLLKIDILKIKSQKHAQ